MRFTSFIKRPGFMMICRLKTFLNGIKLPDVRRDGNRLRGCLKILEETRILDEFLLLPTSLGQLARTWAECPQTMTSSGSWRKLTKCKGKRLEL